MHVCYVQFIKVVFILLGERGNFRVEICNSYL